MFIDGSKFHEQVLKRLPKEHLCKYISKSDQWFQKEENYKNVFMSV